jgi:predicted DCC family thiol-disulfide oxidoreductase YuxK
MTEKIILFDGVCNFCNFWVNVILANDKRKIFKFAPLQSDTGKNLLLKFNLSTEEFSSFILIDGDRFYKKSTAALLVAKDLRGFFKILYPLIIFPNFIRDFFYDIIAKNRYRIFGKRDTCRIPTGEELSRFI